MTKNKLSLEKSVSELERKLLEHIGSNGYGSNEQSVHLPVDTDNAGFATPDMYVHDQQLFTKRKWVANVDILKLAPGYYEGSGFTNHPATATADTPTTWISNVDVIDGDDGRRMIYLMDNLNGYFWKRTLHTGGAPDSGTGAWIKYDGLVTLWSGFSKLDEPATLSSSLYLSSGATLYNTILVKYTTDTEDFGLAYGNLNKVTINALNLNNDPTLKIADFYEAELVFPTGTTAQVTRNRAITLLSSSDDTAHLGESSQKINITKIMGVK
ncbi:hypothetical protein [Lactobacillus sp. 3B(2020)]|uniref:hypothetical protein n=1 Tax=Lactobacillus sp. 3B(2020) TaxID=2695882 RepID=UPI0015DFDC69|nr:hypothetical protein [Lactobacillus sp. 3B(2020)]QLL69607.1 hypothetical protein GTO83_03150 [Lactobacillus sp. 3B(2020)]